MLDDSTYTDLTHDVVASILDEGLESTLQYYFAKSSGKNLKLDTLKIDEASKVLYKNNSPLAAEKLLMFKDMYRKGELDTNFLTDQNFLESLSLNLN